MTSLQASRKRAFQAEGTRSINTLSDFRHKLVHLFFLAHNDLKAGSVESSKKIKGSKKDTQILQNPNSDKENHS